MDDYRNTAICVYIPISVGVNTENLNLSLSQCISSIAMNFLLIIMFLGHRDRHVRMHFVFISLGEKIDHMQNIAMGKKGKRNKGQQRNQYVNRKLNVWFDKMYAILCACVCAIHNMCSGKKKNVFYSFVLTMHSIGGELTHYQYVCNRNLHLNMFRFLFSPLPCIDVCSMCTFAHHLFRQFAFKITLRTFASSVQTRFVSHQVSQ